MVRITDEPFLFKGIFVFKSCLWLEILEALNNKIIEIGT